MKSNSPPRYSDEQINARIRELCLQRMTHASCLWFVKGKSIGRVKLRVAFKRQPTLRDLLYPQPKGKQDNG